jgi:hypothetical protein
VEPLLDDVVLVLAKFQHGMDGSPKDCPYFVGNILFQFVIVIVLELHNPWAID